ncbi:MAG: phosphate ABC transporter permease subunit PstC [Candidatus Ancillula sp.]|jgi:phosphate transport system permease protein|nr:phosphate ABC transporter permease subunit PstC [Candidatus Ancillula sp.]
MLKIASKTSGIIILTTLALVVIFLSIEAVPAIFASQDALRDQIPWFANSGDHNIWQYSIPLLFSTILAALLALLIAVPLSIAVALFLTYYVPKRISSVFGSLIDLLAAIPSVVYGLWAVAVLVPRLSGVFNFLSRNFGWIPLFHGPVAEPPRVLLTVSIVFAVMVIPIITALACEIYSQTPHLNTEAALALGATKWESIRLSVLPFGKSGIISASMLGLGRALGETMAVLMILSPGHSFSLSVLMSGQHQTIAGNIAANFPEAGSLGVSALITTGLVLFLLTFIINFLARKVVDLPLKTKRRKK